MQQLPQANQPHGNETVTKLIVKQFGERTIHLEPGKLKQVPVGSYLNSEQKPSFQILSNPDIGKELSASYETIEMTDKNKYIAFYHIHNFGDKPCEVTIRKAEQ